MSSCALSERVIQQLVNLCHDFDHCLSQALFDEVQVSALHLKRQLLIRELEQSLPQPLPVALESAVRELLRAVDHLTEKLEVQKQATSDDVFQLRYQRKATDAYQSNTF